MQFLKIRCCIMYRGWAQKRARHPCYLAAFGKISVLYQILNLRINILCFNCKNYIGCFKMSASAFNWKMESLPLKKPHVPARKNLFRDYSLIKQNPLQTVFWDLDRLEQFFLKMLFSVLLHTVSPLKNLHQLHKRKCLSFSHN